MLQTAEQVAKRYHISRDARTSTAPPASKSGAAQAAGLFDAEIAPIKTVMGDKVRGLITKEVT
jgi:acetyl-CoA C-acetyltransferase